MKADHFMRKADDALASARLLFANGLLDDCCSRAYYAMFDAARAALVVSEAPVEAEVARTHRGLISGFGMHIVKTGLVSPEIGRSLSQAQNIRLVADYNGDPVSAADAEQLMAWASEFVATIRKTFDLQASSR